MGSDLLGHAMEQPDPPKPAVTKPSQKKPSVYDSSATARFTESNIIMGKVRGCQIIRLSPLTTLIWNDPSP